VWNGNRRRRRWGERYPRLGLRTSVRVTAPSELLSHGGHDLAAIAFDASRSLEPLPQVEVVLERGVGSGVVQTQGDNRSFIGYGPLDLTKDIG
jgi:hypothetical protein